jgi:hypothetical protein
MKKLIFSLFFLAFGVSVCVAQLTTSVQLTLEDAAGRRDTVLFGVDMDHSYGTTAGMDTIWQEQNIVGQAYADLDVRIVQRDSINHQCLFVASSGTYSPFGVPYYTPQHIASKIDFRPTPINSYADARLTNFEIHVHASDYPVKVKASMIEAGTPYAVQISPLDDTCMNMPASDILLVFSAQDSIVLTDSTHRTLIASFTPWIATKKIAAPGLDWNLAPNPARNVLQVQGLQSIAGELTVVNALGEIVLEQSFTYENTTLDIAALPKGYYWLRCYDQNTRQTSTRPFIKTGN